jgi:hypothetical protein
MRVTRREGVPKSIGIRIFFEEWDVEGCSTYPVNLSA